MRLTDQVSGRADLLPKKLLFSRIARKCWILLAVFDGIGSHACFEFYCGSVAFTITLAKSRTNDVERRATLEMAKSRTNDAERRATLEMAKSRTNDAERRATLCAIQL